MDINELSRAIEEARIKLAKLDEILEFRKSQMWTDEFDEEYKSMESKPGKTAVMKRELDKFYWKFCDLFPYNHVDKIDM
jgi:hypothetical protein